MCRSPLAPLDYLGINVTDFRNQVDTTEQADSKSTPTQEVTCVLRGTFLEFPSDRGRPLSRAMCDKRASSWHPCMCSVYEQGNAKCHVCNIKQPTPIEKIMSNMLEGNGMMQPYPTVRKKRETECDGIPDPCIEHIFRDNPTTMMLRNYPRKRSQQQLLLELESSDLAGTFDFLYLPFCFETKQNNGYAFINFKTTAAARRFYVSWNKAWFPTPMRRPMTVSAAGLQGLEANVERMLNECRVKRVMNPKYQPIIFKDGKRMLVGGSSVSRGKKRSGKNPRER